MKTLFHEGDSVRVVRNVRNDGTYPGKEIGDILVRRGETGYVQSIGTFLQDQVIYSVHFIDNNLMVGCREEELISIDDVWLPSKYEFRDKVLSTKTLAIKGEVIVESGIQGEIVKVIKDGPGEYQYHVRFPGKTLQVPESALKKDETCLQQEEIVE